MFSFKFSMSFLKCGHLNWDLQAWLQMDTNHFPCLGKMVEILSSFLVCTEQRCQDVDKCSDILSLEKN